MYNIQPDSDQAIIDAVRDNNPIAWELLFAKYDSLIQSIAGWSKWNFTADEQQDVCQNIHLNLQSALPSFRQQCSLPWFVKRIAVRQCINEIRRQSRWRSVIIPATLRTTDGDWSEIEFSNPCAPDPHDDAVKNEQRQSLRTALQRMHITCRKSINMFYIRHLSYKEMAEQLGISVNTVGSRLSKCLDKLKKELKNKTLPEGIH